MRKNYLKSIFLSVVLIVVISACAPQTPAAPSEIFPKVISNDGVKAQLEFSNGEIYFMSSSDLSEIVFPELLSLEISQPKDQTFWPLFADGNMQTPWKYLVLREETGFWQPGVGKVNVTIESTSTMCRITVEMLPDDAFPQSKKFIYEQSGGPCTMDLISGWLGKLREEAIDAGYVAEALDEMIKKIERFARLVLHKGREQKPTDGLGFTSN